MMLAARSGLHLALLAAALAVAGSTSARANNLDKEACGKLQDELVAVLKTGAADDMARGPAWAKKNASYVVLNNIKQLIDLEAQLRFRCNLANPRVSAIARARKLARDAPPPLPERKPAKVAANTQEDPAIPAGPTSGEGQDTSGKPRNTGSKTNRAYVSPQKTSPYVVLPSGVGN